MIGVVDDYLKFDDSKNDNINNINQTLSDLDKSFKSEEQSFTQ